MTGTQPCTPPSGNKTPSDRSHLLEIYGPEVSPELISTITDEVLAEAAEWQARPLDTM